MSQAEETSVSRWWEFYAVRYGMGTVVGGIVFFFLCFSNKSLKPLLFGAEAGKLDATQLVLLAAYGLAYCYIASAPILVLHVGRFLLDVRPKAAASSRRLVVILAPAVVLGASFFLASAYTRTYEGPSLYFFTLMVMLATILVWPQYLVIGHALFKSKELLSFYQKLSNKRSAAKGGLVDSYRHMREHGNSFFIVLLEVVFALVLFTAGRIEPPTVGALPSASDARVLVYVAIVLIWVLPAALVWLVGTQLEREFSGV